MKIATIIRRGPILVITICLALALSMRASGASAATQLMVSNDGQHWADSLPAPVFDPEGLMVPGDMDLGTFWVRNDASDPGTLTLTATTSNNQLIAPNAVRLAASITGDTWQTLPMGRPIELMQSLRPRDPLRISVRAEFLFSAGNRSEDRLARLNFRVTLTEAAAAPGGGTSTPGGPSTPGGGPGSSGGGPSGSGGSSGFGGSSGSGGVLPNTGSSLPAWLLPLGAIAFGGGLAMLRRRRILGGRR